MKKKRTEEDRFGSFELKKERARVRLFSTEERKKGREKRAIGRELES